MQQGGSAGGGGSGAGAGVAVLAECQHAPTGTALPSTVPAYDLRISIQDTEPEIWRRLLVPGTITNPELHRVIQTAFGWEDRHLFGIRCVDRLGEPRAIIGPDDAAD